MLKLSCHTSGHFDTAELVRKDSPWPAHRRARSTAAARACGPGSRTASPACSIFFFLFAHVLDTALVRVSPDAYNAVIETYKNPIVNLMEVGLVGAVLFHALNGIRIMLVDFWAKGARYQRQLICGVLGVFVVLFVPLRDGRTPAERLREARDRSSARPRSPRRAPRRRARRTAARSGRTNFEMYSWLFMRMSGLLLVVLVLGHLFIMNDARRRRARDQLRASSPAAGPSPFWQVWDLLMLWLAELHGTNGLRTIINDYAEQGRHPVLAEDAALHVGAARPRARHPGDLHLRPGPRSS